MKQASIQHTDLNTQQGASVQLRKVKRKLPFQHFSSKVPESLSASPSIKLSPNCFKAAQHTSKDEKDGPTRQKKMMGIYEWKRKLIGKNEDEIQNYNI